MLQSPQIILISAGGVAEEEVSHTWDYVLQVRAGSDIK